MSASNGHAPSPGFRPKPRTRVAVCTFLEAREGSDPLTAEVALNLSFDQLDALRAMNRSNETTFQEFFAIVSPQVIAWNAMAFNHLSGEWEAVRPPAEIGADALRTQEPMVTIWLARELQRGYDGIEREKKVTASASTPEPSADVSMTPPTPIGRKSRANRKTSTLNAVSVST